MLAAVVLVAVAGLFNVNSLRGFGGRNRTEFITAAAALLGVLGSGLLRGVLIGQSSHSCKPQFSGILD